MPNKPKTSVYGVWRGDRNTPIVVRAKTASEAIRKSTQPVSAGGRPHKALGWNKSVKGVKKLSGQDLKEANSGKWVRTRVSGQRVTGRAPEKNPPKHRPGLYKRRTK
ncbi:hypothetical protein V6O07_10475 [Arthrospira platensis SPKY2]